MATNKYASGSTDPQHHLDQARYHLGQGTDLNEKSGEVLASGTGNTKAAATYRQAAQEHIRLSQECRRRAAELRASAGLKSAFPKDEKCSSCGKAGCKGCKGGK